MLIHLFSDTAFVDFTIKQFNAYLDIIDSRYIVITPSATLKLIQNNEEIVICSQVDEVLRYIEHDDVVIVHYMDGLKAKIISQVSCKAIVWLAWGGDFYGTIVKTSLQDLFEKSTLNWIEAEQSQKEKNKDLDLVSKWKSAFVESFPRLYEKYYYLRTGEYLPKSKYFESLKKIDMLGTVIPDEFIMLVNTKYFQKALSEIHFSYGTVKSNVGQFYNTLPKLGDNILVGNSATPANNHLDAIEELSDIQDSYQKVIIPLSYGNQEYANWVIQQGQMLLGDRLEPLLEFLPINEYIDNLLSCKAMVMNHKRQQAVGNIITGLYLGMKVFLNSQSIVYTFLKRKGMIIFTISELNDEIESKLTQEKITHNRNVLETIWGEQIVNDRTKVLAEKLASM